MNHTFALFWRRRVERVSRERASRERAARRTSLLRPPPDAEAPTRAIIGRQPSARARIVVHRAV